MRMDILLTTPALADQIVDTHCSPERVDRQTVCRTWKFSPILPTDLTHPHRRALTLPQSIRDLTVTDTLACPTGPHGSPPPDRRPLWAVPAWQET